MKISKIPLSLAFLATLLVLVGLSVDPPVFAFENPVISSSSYTSERQLSVSGELDTLLTDTCESCLQSGISDPDSLSQTFYQEFEFSLENLFSPNTFSFVSCWSGSDTGCSASDKPEFDISSSGIAQVEVLVDGVWVEAGSPIGLGHMGQSSVTTPKEFSVDLPKLDSSENLRIRIATSGTWFGTRYDVHQFIQSVSLS